MFLSSFMCLFHIKIPLHPTKPAASTSLDVFTDKNVKSRGR